MEALMILKSIFSYETPESYKASKERFESVIYALDKLPGLFEEVFTRTRNYKLGLDFFDICYKEINYNKDKIVDWEFKSYQEYLIKLRLHMLDGLNEWEEYISYSDWIIQNIKLPYRFNLIADPDDKYFYYYGNEKQIHFLFLEKPRYDIILRKLQKQAACENVDRLKRHQRNELSDEDIENRYMTVLSFFESAYRKLKL